MLAVVALYGVVAGVIAGVIAACVMFTLLYGRVSCVRMAFDATTRTSTVERSIEDAARLRELGTQVCGMCLQGFLFFGTANSILQRVRERLEAKDAVSVRYIVLDFASTNGMDASVSIAFVKLRQLCASSGADLVLTALPARSRSLLVRTGTLNLRIHEFATLDAGLEWIEDTLLGSGPAMQLSGNRISVRHSLRISRHLRWKGYVSASKYAISTQVSTCFRAASRATRCISSSADASPFRCRCPTAGWCGCARSAPARWSAKWPCTRRPLEAPM